MTEIQRSLVAGPSALTQFYNNFFDDESQLYPPLTVPTMFTQSISSSDPPSPQSDDYEDFVDMPFSNDATPMLSIVEQPVSKFRFRYRSEMQGAHGSLLGRRETSKKKTYPTVELLNFDGEAIIRCSLYTAELPYTPHVHQLIAKQNNKEKLDHEILISERNGYRAEFKGLGIVHISKKDLISELVRKKEKTLLEKLRLNEHLVEKSDDELRKVLSTRIPELEKAAAKEAKTKDANKVRLCFEAFVKGPKGEMKPLCPSVFSDTIQNMKSAETGDLKICRIDRCAGTCIGGDEIFLLVEKVCKKNISVRFFETDEDGERIWQALGEFSDFDVHHQYAIVLRTPPYKTTDITEPVRVKMELFRPKGNAVSEPRWYTYKPARRYGKRTCTRSSQGSIGSFEDIHAWKQPVLDQDPFLSGSSDLSSHNSLTFNSDTIKNALADLDKNGPDFSLFEKFLQSGDFSNYSQSFAEEPTIFYVEGPQETSKTFTSSFDALGEREQMLESPMWNVFDTGFGVEGQLDIVTDGCDTKVNAKKAVYYSKANEERLNHEMDVGLKEEAPTFTPRNTLSLAKEACSRLLKIVKSRNASRFQDMKNVIRAEDRELGPLHAAAYHNQLKELGDLLSLIIKSNQWKLINSVNRRKETPLMVAVEAGNEDCARLLCMAGANVNCTDYKDNTALHIAVQKKHSKCVKALFSVKPVSEKETYVKIDIDKKNEKGEAALHIAVQQKDLECVKLLVEREANVNVKTGTFGETPLHLAVKSECTEIISFLLKQENINLKVKNFGNKTALDFVQPNRMDIIALFGQAFEEGSDCSDETLHIIDKVLNDVVESTDEEDADDDESEESEEDEEFEDACNDIREMRIESAREEETVSNPLNDVKIKKRAPSSDSYQMIKAEEQTTLMDKATLDIVVKNLDRGKKWMELCHHFNCSFLIGNVSKLPSPTQCLISYLEFKNEVTLSEFRDAVEKLQVVDAVKAMDKLLLERKS